MASDPADVADAGLVGIRATSSTDVWAAGWQSSSAGLQPLVERWQGSGWHRVSVADPGLPAALTGITAVGGGIWAAGFTYDGYTYRPVTEHWDGSSWSVESGPSTGPHFGVFRNVAAFTQNDTWALGDSSGSGRVLKTLGEH